MGRPSIKDEFTELPVSRQRKWQLRNVRDGVCSMCGKPVVFRELYCFSHRIMHAKNQLRQRVSKGQFSFRRGKWVAFLADIEKEELLLGKKSLR